jgi:hypothetical protein
LGRARRRRTRPALIVQHPLGDAIETFICREDAERLVEDVRNDEPELARDLRIEESEPETGGLN